MNLKLVNADELNISVNFQRNIANHSFTSYVYSTQITGTGGGLGSFSSIGQTIVAPTIGIPDPAGGAMVLGFAEWQTALLTPGQTYRWYLRWVAPGDITRTVLSGTVEAVAP